jgi:hypothetical protein
MIDKPQDHLEAPSAGPAEAQHEDPSDDTFEPKAYFWGAWHLIKQDLFIFAWKLLADGARAVVSIATLLAIGVVLFVSLTGAMATQAGPFVGLERFVADLATPQFVIGAAGLLFCAWLIGLTLDVLALSGIWGTFAQGARGRPIRRFRTFFANLTTRFPAVLSLRITTLAAQGIVGLLGLMVLVGIWGATTGDGTFADSSVWVRALLWATPLTLMAGFAALVRLTMEVAAAPLIMERRSLGDAIATAAELVTRRFAQVYRLVIVAAGLLLVPLFFYWGVLIFQNLTLDMPELAPLTGMLRLVGEVVLFVTTGAIAVAFYGALFVYYAVEMGMIDEIPGEKEKKDKATSPSFAGRGPRAEQPRGPRTGPVRFDKHTTIEELLPVEYPNIMTVDEVLGTEPSEADAPLEADLPGLEDDSVSDVADDERFDDISGDDVFDSTEDEDT